MLYLLSYDRHTKRGTLGHLERFCEVASLLFQMKENSCGILRPWRAGRCVTVGSIKRKFPIGFALVSPLGSW